MRLGISSHAYRWASGWGELVKTDPMTIGRFLDESLSIAGVQGVQICDNIHPERLAGPGSDRQRVESAIARGRFVELGAGSAEPEYLEALLGLSKDFGADVLRLVMTVHRDERGRPDRTQLQTAERHLRETLPTARRLGVRLAIENHWELPAAELRALLRRIDDEYLGICLDTANPACGGEDPLETVKLLAPYAINVHLKDYRITRNLNSDPAGYRIIGVAFGEGWLPTEQVVEVLRSQSPAESYHVELFLDRARTAEETVARERDAVRRSVENARRLLSW